MQYFFILGKNPLLSKAEIEAVLEFLDYRFKIIDYRNKVLVIEMEKELEIDAINSRLGGTVKIGKILDKVNKFEEFEDKFFKLVKFGAGKIFFGFSLYSLSPEIKVEKYQSKSNAIAMDIKGILREEFKINSRYVVSREPELSSVIVAKNKLLKNGAEICFFINKHEMLFGQTLAVQQFEEFGARDYSRPSRDDVSGMLPPKLARMMINLVQVKSDATILDPFCGSGTILQEALVLGYSNLIGTDNSEKAIEDTNKNLSWLNSRMKAASSDGLVRQAHHKLGKASPEPAEGLTMTDSAVKVFKLDVKDLSSKFKANSIDAIITEPYLGPAMRGNETQAQIEKNIETLDSLYLSAFVQFPKVLVAGGKVVIVFPIYKIKNYESKIEILPQIEKLGFQKINKEELIYFREKQFVRRSIEIFIKK